MVGNKLKTKILIAMRSNIVLCLLLLSIGVACESDLSSAESAGQGGSMTRFAITGNYLYVLDHSTIQVFSLASQGFQEVNSVPVSFGLETIFAKGEYLYLGATDGMYIFSISQPEVPSFIFKYTHIVSCDPVVVQGNRAYVTLRTAPVCGRGINSLEIIDVTDPHNPSLIANYTLRAPRGLAVDGSLLFICEGEFGLKVFDISNERDIKLVDEVNDVHAYDVIARNGVLTLTGEDGVFQYSYEVGKNEVTLLSKIPVLRTDV